MAQTLGLIAGDGQLPLEVARAARRRRTPVVALAFPGLSDARLEREVDRIHWLELGALGALLEGLHKEALQRVVLAGKVSKAKLFEAGAERRLDERARRWLAGVDGLGDAAILRALAALFESEGLRLESQLEWLSHLVCEPGPLGEHRPDPAQLADVAFGAGLARQLAALDVGQTVVVKDRAVAAVEALEGSDAAIRRGGALAGAGSCVVKCASAGADPRFDLPTVGPETLRALVEAKATVLAFEARRGLVLERETLVALADAHGIAVLAVGEDVSTAALGAIV